MNDNFEVEIITDKKIRYLYDLITKGNGCDYKGFAIITTIPFIDKSVLGGSSMS